MTLRARAIVMGAFSLLMVILAVPSFVKKDVREASPWISDAGLNLGLDLQGGIHWLLRLDTEAAVKQKLGQIATDLQTIQTEEGLSIGTAKLTAEENAINVCGGNRDALQDLLADRYPTVDSRSGPGDCVVLTLTDRGLQTVTETGIAQALEVLKERLNIGGIKEPLIAAQGRDRILVQLPGADVDPVQARKLISETTFLAFKKVLKAAPSAELLEASYEAGLPEGTEIVLNKRDDATTEAYLVPKQPILTGAMLEDAGVSFDRRQRPIVTFQWNGEGTKIFRDFTTENIGERMAVIKDGNVITAPEIKARIGRSGIIEGNFDVDSARTLAVQLRSGALPIPLKIEEERTVGPALGEDSIRRGLLSIAIGGLSVILFMIAYYRSSGVLANVALLLNIVIIIAVMGIFEATLTLPGIAGLVLTVGMAVDANVIIFERIREELRSNKTLRNSIQVGFNRSRWTILDANITTFIAAIVLYYVGRGPIQGFGVTLAIGIFSSVFCALVVTRLLVDLVLSRGNQALRI